MDGATRSLARYVIRSRWSELPQAVRHHAARSFLNWLGCALRGSQHPALERALAASRVTAGPAQATVIGRGERLDIANAALLNGLSASAYAFDDTHLPTIAHPTAPAAAALLALAEHRPVTGQEFLHALALANEIQCRLSSALAVRPAHCHVGHYMTGLTGAPGVAAAAAKLLGLDEQQVVWAIGIGAAQAGGIRATHASMCSGFVPAHAGRNGLTAALLAAHGFTGNDAMLEARNGFADVYGAPANLDALTGALGEHFECLSIAEKPYPAGVFIHPAIEACLALTGAMAVSVDRVARLSLRVHPLGLGLTGHRSPQHAYDAQVSVYHWAAAALVFGKATLDQATDDCVHDQRVLAMRSRVDVVTDATLGADAAIAELTLHDGSTHRAHIDPCVGSARKPMTDRQLEQKFLDQVEPIIPARPARDLIARIWDCASAPDVSRIAPGVWGAVDTHTGSPN